MTLEPGKEIKKELEKLDTLQLLYFVIKYQRR